MSAVLELLEYQPIPYERKEGKVIIDKRDKNIEISEKTFQKLLDFNELNENSKFLDVEARRIKARNLVGIVKIDDLTIQILPKILPNVSLKNREDRGRLIRALVKMLEIAWDIPPLDITITSLPEEMNLIIEVLITLYSIKLLEALKEGFYKEYVNIEEDAPYVKGQINFNRYVQHWERRHIIPIRYNDRDPDNTINRTLKYGTHLATMHTNSRDNRVRLNAIRDIMYAVSDVVVSSREIERIAFNRLNERFRPLVNLAKVFIKHRTPIYKMGESQMYSFLIPMERLFEEFVANLLKYHILPKCCKDAEIYIQDETKRIPDLKKPPYLLEGGRFSLKPDILIRIDDKNYIIDTKYKILKLQERMVGVSQQDVYQMLAYTIAFKSEKTMLLYPKSLVDEELTKEPWKFVGHVKELEGKVLCIDTLDISKILSEEKLNYESIQGKIKSFLGLN